MFVTYITSMLVTYKKTVKLVTYKKDQCGLHKKASMFGYLLKASILVTYKKHQCW